MITNILLTEGGHNKGYLPKDVPLPVLPTFATANMAIRKSAMNRLAGFDVRCQTGEDMDLGLRMMTSKGECYFEPRAIVYHKHRTTLVALLQQWFGYALSHPYVLKKHTLPGFHVYWLNRNRTRWKGFHMKRILGIKIPIYTFIYLTSFHYFHLFGVIAILSILCSQLGVFVPALLGMIYFGARVSSSTYSKKYSLKERLMFTLIRYLLNWAYVLGGLWGGLRVGVFYLEAARES